MLRDLIRNVATETGLTQARTREALGIVFNAAERQGAPFIEALFKRLPGARTLAARTGSEIGAPNGAIARLIEQTRGGRQEVAASMIRELHARGLGHRDIATLLPAVASYAEQAYGIRGFGHLGDLLGRDRDAVGVMPEHPIAAVA